MANGTEMDPLNLIQVMLAPGTEQVSGGRARGGRKVSAATTSKRRYDRFPHRRIPKV